MDKGDPANFATSSPLKTKAASPNCAAYFFKHGYPPTIVDISDADASTTMIGSEADVNELVNRY